MFESFIQKKQEDQKMASLEGSIPGRFDKIYSIGESIRNFKIEEGNEIIDTRETIKEIMKLIQPLVVKGLSDPRLIDMNNRLLALTEASNNVFDDPKYIKEQKDTATKLLQDAIRFRLLSKIDLDLKPSTDLFVETMEHAREKEHRINKIKNHHFFPTFAFGLSSIRIDCDLGNPDREISIKLFYPVKNEQSSDENANEDLRYKQESFEIFFSKGGMVLGGKGYDKVTLPTEISFIKLSEVIFDVSDEIERLSSVPSATVEYYTEEQVSGGQRKARGEPQNKERIPIIIDPVREKILIEAARKHNRREIGVVNVESISELVDGGTKFNDYRLFLYDVGIVLINGTIGNATYFSKIDEDDRLEENMLSALKEVIDNYNKDEGGDDDTNELILDYIFQNMDSGFFHEGARKLDLRELPNVTTIIHNEGWQARLEAVFR